MVTPSFSSHASNFEKLGVTIRQINIIIIKLKTISCYLLIIVIIIIVVVHGRLIHAISFLVAQDNLNLKLTLSKIDHGLTWSYSPLPENFS